MNLRIFGHSVRSLLDFTKLAPLDLPRPSRNSTAGRSSLTCTGSRRQRRRRSSRVGLPPRASTVSVQVGPGILHPPIKTPLLWEAISLHRVREEMNNGDGLENFSP